MPRWQLLAGPAADGPQIELTTATARKITVRLGQPCDVAFSINGRHEQAADITEFVTDIWAYRDRQLLHRGRVGTTSDDVNTDSHTTTVNAPDYRALLDRRHLYDGDKLSYVQEDQAAIAWQLIQATQGKTGGNLGITRGSGQTTGFLRDRLYTAGISTAEAITQLADLDGGFDWEIDPQLRLNLFNPQRGRDTDVVLEFGGAVASFSRAVLPAEYGNAVRAIAGTDPRAPETREAADLATRPGGRIEIERGFPDILEQSTLAARADYLLADAQVLRPSYTLTLAPGRYPGPQALWVGDSCIVAIRSGRLSEHDRQRVMEISFEPGADGDETVRVTVGRSTPAGLFGQRMRRLDGRLSVLERQ
jgi:hypothetical protein